ncbi:MAG: protease modulator HflC [Bacteriovoracaceae bacterium]
MKSGLGLILFFAALITFNSSFYIIQEGRQAIITQFGQPIGEPIVEAGARFKTPFIQEVRYVDKRILSWDGFPNQIPTKDKKYISVDTTARWRVVNALEFIKSVKNERGAKDKLDAILDAATRNVISNHNLVEAVRNGNDILNKIQERKDAVKKRIQSGEEVVDEEVTGEIENVGVGREKLSEMIKELAIGELKEFGIDLIDVQLRRISYEASVEKKVYERMISERQRIAQKIRSIGQGEKSNIEGRIQKDLKEIESEAYRKAQKIRGEGEAKAFKIYADSLSKDPKFYEFIRSMEAYKRSIKPDSKFIISPDSEYFKFLK